MDAFKFDVTGIPQFLGRIDELNELLADPTELLQIVGIQMKSQIERNFRAATDPVSGDPWKPTTQFTLRNRPGGGKGGKTLQDTGRLLGSLVNANPTIADNSVSITSNLVYADIHNTGGTITPVNGKFLRIPTNRKGVLGKKGGTYAFAKSVTIPKRRYTGFNEAYRDELIEVAIDTVMEIFNDE